MILHQAELCGLHLRLCENFDMDATENLPRGKWHISKSGGGKAVLLISTHVLGFIAVLERI